MILSYLVSLLILVAIYYILALGLNLAIGYAGLLNLGHVALFGIGAYTAALLTIHGVPFLISFLAAGIFASLFGLLLIFATKSLKGDYYALATLGFGFVVYSLLVNLVSVTRGPMGIAGIPRPVIFGFVIGDNMAFLLLALIIVLLSTIFVYRVVRSPFGRLLEAMRDDEIGLRVLGKDTTKLKYKAAMTSGFFAGIAGSLLAHYISFIDPSSFILPEIILVLTIVIIGGIASIQGTIIASLIVVLAPELLRLLNIPSSIIGPARQIIYGLILILIIIYRPRGLCGRIDLE
jgi:branched-chain amino acid transport system permease protein